MLPLGKRERAPHTKAANCNLKMAKKMFKKPGDEVVVDIGAPEGYAVARLGHAPCITRRRAKNFEYWLVKRHRRVDVRDLCILQGMGPIQTKKVPKTAVGAAIGNAMSHNVFKSLMPCCLRVAGLINWGRLFRVDDAVPSSCWLLLGRHQVPRVSRLYCREVLPI